MLQAFQRNRWPQIVLWVLIIAVIVVVLQFRPAGLFPQKGRMVEA